MTDFGSLPVVEDLHLSDCQSPRHVSKLPPGMRPRGGTLQDAEGPPRPAGIGQQPPLN